MEEYADSCDCTSGCDQCYDQALAEAEAELEAACDCGPYGGCAACGHEPFKD